jgi:Tol biopolymer transport system component
LTDVLSRLSAALANHYALERELGHGGMATVYLARDLKHGRMVALKVLRPELAASLGPRRFLNEIEIAAQLQHPHILPLLDSGEVEGFLYYVMPYVEGESLRERLARQGELPVSEAVRILAEMAEALAYAHGRGLVHRDMKPENIMLSGRHPLVMDFGIAKAVSTLTTGLQVTTEGVALGTPAYMAPEQAAADTHLDHRVDIYALGVIGYEMLAGTTPFTGTSAQQILAAHMTQKPEPISSRRPAVLAPLATIIMRCLEKRPADRPQSADELLRSLELLLTPGEGLTPTGSRPAPGRRTTISPQVLMATCGILVALVIGGLLWQGRAAPSRVTVARHGQLTFLGNAEQQDISPDGQLLALIEGGPTQRLMVKDLTGGSSIHIATLGTDFYTLRWSPDGSSILYTGYDSSGKYARLLLPRLGGSPRPLPKVGVYALLSPDGARIASWYQPAEHGIEVLTLRTGAKRVIRVPEDRWLSEGDWSPTGAFIALSAISRTGNRSILRTVDVETGASHEVVRDTVPLSSPRWSPKGDALYYLRDERELRKVPITAKGQSRASPETLQTGLQASGLSLTRDGKKLAYIRRESHSNLWLATQSAAHRGFAAKQLTQGTAGKIGARLSPDGRLIAFVQDEQKGKDLFIVPLEGGTPKRVSSSGVASSNPVWSPDGRFLAFVGAVEGNSRVRTVSIETGEERIYENTDASADEADLANLAWSPQDRILYHRPGNRNFFWLDPASGAEQPLVKNDSVGWMFTPIPSPDGKNVAVFWNRKPQRGTFLISLEDTSQVPTGPPGGWPLGWSPQATALYVIGESPHQIYRVPTQRGEGVVIGTSPFKDATCEARERLRRLVLVCNVKESVSDVWVMENFDPALAHASQ